MKKLLMILPLALILCFMVGCQDKEAMAELEAMKAQAEVEEQNKVLAQRILSEGDKKNLEFLDEVCTSDYKFYFPTNATPINLEEHKELWQAFNDAFPDLTHTIKEIYTDGEIVVGRLIFSGTHEGVFQGIPATGNKIESSGIWLARIENGKVVEVREDADLLGMMQQIGMELKPKETEK